MAERSFTNNSNQSLAGFVPALVIDYLLEKLRKKELRKLPEKQSFDSVVMFADISGFTNLAEKLSKKGPEGTELLAFTLNRYMELLVNGISRSGGDIFKFAGDAMIIVWPPPANNGSEELTILCRQAIQSALDIQSKLTGFKIIDDVKLSVKIGFGVGQVTIAHVGGVFQRAEYLPAGSPLNQAFECEHLAPGGGVVICSKQIWERCGSFFEFEQITDLHEYKGENAPFFFVKKVKKMVKMKADAFLIKNKFKPGDIEAIRSYLKSYIPAAVIPFIELDQEKWSAELRRLSVMFVNLGIDLRDAQSQSGLERIQQVIECVQRCVYSNQGSLNKFLMDDKGSTLIVVFGLYPMAHQDDPVRAVLTATSLVNELKPIKCPCSIGVTTGMVFAGVVGTSGNRREYSVLGDSVNLSARLMQAACLQKEKKVLVCETTKLEAEHKLRFRFVMKSVVKGKSGEIPFFEPVEEELEAGDERVSRETKVNSITIDKIKIHVVNGWENKRMLGASYEGEMLKSASLLEKFLNKPSKNGLVMITGSYGSGKSLMVTGIIEKMAARIESFSWKYNEKIHVYTNSLNSVEKAKKLNGWRRILQEILIRLSLRMKQNSESLLLKLLEKHEELLENLHLVQEILNIKLKLPHNSKNNKFIQRGQEIYERKIIRKILLKILLKYLEEDEKVVENSLEDDNTSILLSTNTNADSQTQRKPIHSNINLNTAAPLIIILDDMQDYDHISWDFSFKVLRKVKKIFIFACIRTKFIELPPVFKKQDSSPHSNKQNASSDSASVRTSHRKTLVNRDKNAGNDANNQEELVESGVYEFEEICENSFFSHVELQGLAKHELESLLLRFLNVKSIEFANLDKFYAFLMDKTEGIPLDLLHLMEKITGCGYGVLKIANKSLYLKQELLKMIEMNEFLTLEPPLCKIKVNGPITDRLSCAHLLVMKAAAVIGDVFDLQTLMKLNPYQSSIPSEKLRNLVHELERQDFIEILDDQSNNIRYRFTLPFMREVLYQRIIYNHRRVIHRYVAEAIQAIPLAVSTPGEEKLECDRLIYHWSLAENRDPFLENPEELGADFSNKAKRSIIVKKISSLLSKSPNNLNVIIKKGDLDKKSDKGFKWSRRYCLMNTREFKYYYTEQDYSNKDSSIDEPLGTIPFKNIFQIMPLNESESKGKPYAFVIYVGSWQKKGKEMGIREFYFSAYSVDELEQWTTYMEFIRAKAIYDAFVNTFGKISFPLTNNALEKIDSLDENGKFSQGMSRMALLTQKAGSHQSFLNTYKSHNSSIRKTTFKTGIMRDKTRKDLLFSDSKEINSSENAISNYNAECHKKLKERIVQFFQSSHFLFWAHAFEMSAKYTRKGAKNEIFTSLGNNTQYMKEKNHHFFFERSLFDDVLPPQSMLDKRVSKYHTSFSINGRSSAASFMYNSVDSLEDLSNNGSPGVVGEKQSQNSKDFNSNFNNSNANSSNNANTGSINNKYMSSGFSNLRALSSVDENISEEVMSPQVKFKKSVSLKVDDKIGSQNPIVKSETEINYNKNERILEKIEEVNETRDSLAMQSDSNFDILKGNATSNANEERNSNTNTRRKSKFLSMITQENDPEEFKEQQTNRNSNNYAKKQMISSFNTTNNNNNISESMRNMPVLSIKGSIERQYKYLEEPATSNGEYEFVVKTKKANFSSKNENYGDLFKDLPMKSKERMKKTSENQIDSLRNIKENTEEDENSMKELLRNSINRVINEEYMEKDDENANENSSLNTFNNNNNNSNIANTISSFNNTTYNKSKKSSKIHENARTNREVSFEKWEKDNEIQPNEEFFSKKPTVFSEKDFEFIAFPNNLKENKSKINESMYSWKNPQENGDEIVITKKKMKNYSSLFQNNSNFNKNPLSDEDKVFFKDYESLIQAKKWDSKITEKQEETKNLSPFHSQKQENLYNFNYKSVKNFQSKNFH